MVSMIVTIFFGIVCVVFFTIGVIGKDQRMIRLGMALAVMTMIVYFLSIFMGETFGNKPDQIPLGIYMRVTKYDEKGPKVTVLISNQSGGEMTYGNEYALQVMEDDEWKDVAPEQEYVWTEEAHILKDLEEAEEVYDLSYFGDLAPGTYKLCKTDLEAEFTVD